MKHTPELVFWAFLTSSVIIATARIFHPAIFTEATVTVMLALAFLSATVMLYLNKKS
jgi:hypothetical protein